MRTITTILVFVVFISLGIFLDSLAINFIMSFFKNISATWLVVSKICLWTLFAYFTGGLIFAASFVAAGAIRNSVNNSGK